MYDCVIKNVRIFDGTVAPWFRGSIAIQEGKIQWVGPYRGQAAREVVDGQDHCLAPGFIDIHCHSDTTLPTHPQAESRILQGVTTEIGGACGLSVSPVGPTAEKKKMLRDYVGELPYEWETTGEYLAWLEKKKPSVNFGTAVGHGAIRLAAMGFEARRPSEREMDQMRCLLRQSLEDGAFAMSSGLIYPPGCYADVDELAELAKELAPYGAFYETHMRNEGNDIVPALQEALEVCRRSGVPLEISHHKVTRKQNWRVHAKTTIAMIQQARRQGLDVTCDQYPYRASSTTLDSNVPQWAFAGGMEALLKRLEDPALRQRMKDESNASHLGRWGDIYISYAASKKNAWVVGKNLEEIAAIRGIEPVDACFDLIYEERGRVNEVQYGMCEDDIEYIMAQPFVMIGSDGSSAGLDYPGQPHPRWYGTFPRVISWYCRQRQLFPLETAIHKMTGMPAARLGLEDRGLIREGMWADLVLFDASEIEDTPTFDDPKRPCAGIRRVYVNGTLTAQDGHHTGAGGGHILRHN